MAPKPSKIPQNPQTWGGHIKKRRLELGLFQAQVARIIEVDESTVTNWEKEHTEPMLWIIPKIIGFLGYEPYLMPKHTVGQKIKAYRILKGINQEELARQLGIDPTTLGKWERDECRQKGKIKPSLESFFNTIDSAKSCFGETHS